MRSEQGGRAETGKGLKIKSQGKNSSFSISVDCLFPFTEEETGAQRGCLELHS